ncbi:small multi-drug export protein [Natranaerobius thermophilus]
MEYIMLAVTAWLLGFIPYFEIYLAVPATIAMGLDPISSVFWAGLGNFSAVPVILFAQKKLSHIPRIAAWLEKLTNSKYRETIDRFGSSFVLLFTPVTGIWIAAALASTFGYRGAKLMITSAFTVLLYGSLVAVATSTGLELIGLLNF